MTSRRKFVTTPRAEAHLFLAKAEQFSAEAASAIASSRNDAAMLNAIHAAISATDAVCIALGGRRSAEPDHQRAADLLEEIGGVSTDIASQVRSVRRLLAKKNVVEYESRKASAREARDAVVRAERLVDWTRETIASARL